MDDKIAHDVSSAHVETGFDRDWRDEQWTGHRKLSVAAQENTAAEQQLSPLKAIKAYPMAIFWSLAVATCVIMEGRLSS
jgi:hypothetical protein